MPKRYGYYIRLLHRCMGQTITNALSQMDVTAAQGPILGYITHRKTPPCSRDIEEEFHLSHPTVSGILNRLEKKGFLEFRTDPEDRRCKRIYLLEKGWQCDDLTRQTIRSTEKQMLQGFTQEEEALFAEFLQRAITNMGIEPCKKHKEE